MVFLLSSLFRSVFRKISNQLKIRLFISPALAKTGSVVLKQCGRIRCWGFRSVMWCVKSTARIRYHDNVKINDSYLIVINHKMLRIMILIDAVLGFWIKIFRIQKDAFLNPCYVQILLYHITLLWQVAPIGVARAINESNHCCINYLS